MVSFKLQVWFGITKVLTNKLQNSGDTHESGAAFPADPLPVLGQVWRMRQSRDHKLII